VIRTDLVKAPISLRVIEWTLALAAFCLLFGTWLNPPADDSTPEYSQKDPGRWSAQQNVLRFSGPRSNVQVHGIVVDLHQLPVADALLAIEGEGKQWTSQPTTSDGHFSVDVSARGKIQIKAIKSGLYSEVVALDRYDGRGTLIITMYPGYKLALRVVEADTGLPIDGARISTSNSVTVTSHGGRAEVTGLRERDDVTVTGRGYAPTVQHVFLGGEHSLVSERTVMLVHGSSLSGMVTDPTGVAVAGAVVRVTARDGWVGTTNTDHTGTFRFDVLGAGRHILHASTATQNSASDLPIVLDGATPLSGVTLTISNGGQLVGRVTYNVGTPIVAAEVTLQTKLKSPIRTSTDLDGRFEFMGLPLGTMTLYARSDRGASEITTVRIAARREYVPLTLVDTTIAGVAEDSKNIGVAGAVIVARSQGPFGPTTVTISDADGSFDFGGMPPGEWVLSARLPGQGDATRVSDDWPVKAGDTHVELRIRELASLTGRVMLDGKPVVYYGIMLTETPQFSWQQAPHMVSTESGRFKVSGISPGEWSILLAGPGFATKIIENVSLGEAENLDIGDVAVDHGSKIRGRVVDTGGTPVANAVVRLQGLMTVADAGDFLRRMAEGHRSTVTNSDGYYSMDGISQAQVPLFGTLAVVASHASLGVSEAQPIGDLATIPDLRIEPAGRIEGTVNGLRGEAAAVLATRAEGGLARARYSASVGAAGEFVFDSIPAGDYSLQLVRAPASGRPPISIHISRGETKFAEFSVQSDMPSLTINTSGGDCSFVFLMSSSMNAIVGAEQCDRNSARFDEIEPGGYTACVDGKICTPVTVTATSQQQSVDIPIR
jgi:protocatechuate 3,4-dioxygenase beta subunit